MPSKVHELKLDSGDVVLGGSRVFKRWDPLGDPRSLSLEVILK